MKSGDLQYNTKAMIPTPTNKSSFGGHFGKFQSHQSSKGSLKGMNQMSSNSN